MPFEADNYSKKKTRYGDDDDMYVMRMKCDGELDIHV